MSQAELLREIVATYQKYGWQLRRALLTPQTQKHLPQFADALAGIPVREHETDALWFSRPSHAGREAWELRWLNPMPYALFETFEPDEPEDARQDARQDMEARLRERARVCS
jgi:hypothetical protein